jgi:tetratricopeptide (TPR) repeat protein
VQTEIKTAPDRNLKVRDALDRAAARIGTRFQNRPLVEAAIHYSIGDAYGGLGETEKAEKHLREALQQQRQAPGDEHSTTFQTVSRLDMLYLDQHQYEKAEALWKGELERQQAVLGDENRVTLRSMDRLAVVYLNWGRYEKAESVSVKVLELCRKILDPGDPLRLDAVNDLANIYIANGQLPNAERLLLQSIESRGSASSDRPLYKLNAMENLARLYQRRYQYKDAESLVVEALKMKRQSFGELAPGTLSTLSYLGLLFNQDRQYAKAEPLLLQALEGQRNVVGGRNPATLVTLEGLAGLYFEQGQYLKAEPLYVEALNARPFREASEDFTRAITAKTETLTRRPSDAGLLVDRGLLYARLGRFHEAADDFTKAMDLAPEQMPYCHGGLPLLLQSGQISEYERRRSQVLKQFAGATRETAHTIAKDAFMAPIEGDELRVAAELAERALRDDPGEWAWQAKGLSEYRQGHFAAAIPWFIKSQTERESPMARDTRMAVGDFFIAMANHRLGEELKARDSLARGVEVVETRLPKAGQADLTASFFKDWILCDVSRRDAEDLIDGKPPTMRPGAATQASAQEPYNGR